MTEISRSDLDADERVADAIRAHVAEREGVPPSELAPPAAVVDEAFVERVCRGCDGAAVDGRVSFDYDGYAVTVSVDGRATVEPNPGVTDADRDVTADDVLALFRRGRPEPRAP